MLQEIDSFLIDEVFQPLAHKFQRLTGKTNFWLAKWCGIMTAISGISFATALYYKYETPGLFFLGVAILYAFWMLITIIYAEIKDQSIPDHFLNTDRIRYVPDRMVILLLLLVSSIILPSLFLKVEGLFLELSIIFGWWSIYFMSCTPLPPGTSKFRKWLNRLLWKLNE